jgi:Flp pilus assembly CpaF family ATPase
MLNAMSQGNDGSLSTMHARSSANAFTRIATYAAEAEGLAFAVTHSLIAESVDFVVFIRKSRLDGGRRTVTEIREVSGFDGERVASALVFEPSRVSGRAERSQYAITEDRRERLEDAGYDDVAWFGSL